MKGFEMSQEVELRKLRISNPEEGSQGQAGQRRGEND